VGQNQTGPLTAFGLTILAIAGDAMAAGILPPGTQVPVHFGASITPDWSVSPMHGVLIWAASLSGFWLVMMLARAALLRSPRMASAPRTVTTFDTVWLALSTLQIVLNASAFAVAFGHPVDIGVVLNVLLGGLLVLIGNLFGTLSPNPIIGIRLPWTMRNRDVWDRTHRTGGRIFILAGMCQVAVSLLAIGMRPAWRGPSGAASLVVFSIAACIACGVVSWRYAQDMEKR